MKRYLTFMVLLVCAISTAQNSNDLLRYSTENLQGTARFQAMGGAFGALGGDLSALNINPAGSAVFNNSLFTFSGSVYNTENASSYFDGSSFSEETNVEINQVGGVLVFDSANKESGWNKIAIAANYDVVQNFNDRISIQGSGGPGIDNYFLNFAQGLPLGAIAIQEGEFIEEAYLDIGARQGFADQQAFLGFESGVIDPAEFTDENTVYNSNSQYNRLTQDLQRRITGYNSKFTLNFASQYKERLHLGASINIHNILYDRYDEFTETNYDVDSDIQRTTFDNLLRTEGSGFSFSLGAIAKLNDVVRLGGSYQSPIWYRLEDNLSQRISTDFPDANENINFINLDVVNLFPTYKIKTPAKLTGSAAFVFGKNGLISADYSYQDMSQAELRPANDENFATVNSEVANTFGGVSSIRVGGEYRIERFSLRGGYRFEQSPYADGSTIGDLTGYSAGIGYDFGGSRLDLALNRSERDISQTLFDTGLTTPANINGINTNATLSYTLNF